MPKPYTGKHCRAKQKKKETHDFDCTKYIKYYSPKAQLHALYHKQHKKVSSFVVELCISLPRNRMTYVCVSVCVCGVKTAIDRVKGFSSGCFRRRPR